MALTRVETTQADWQAGTLSGVVATSAGDLVLGVYQSIIDNFNDNSIDPTWMVFTNTGATISEVNGRIEITAPANYHASIERSIASMQNATATVKVNAVSGDVGSSWGPSLAFRWPNGHWISMHLHAGQGKFVLETSTAVGITNVTFSQGVWYWMRLRLDATTIYGEVSSNGSVWNLVASTSRTAEFSGSPDTIGIGKHPFTHDDYTTAGNTGTSYFDDVSGSAYYASGTRTSPALDLSSVGVAASSRISWTATTPTNTAIAVDVSLDGGATWQSATNGGAIPGITPGMDLSGKSLLVRQTLSTSDPTVTPTLSDLTVTVGSLQSASASALASGTVTGSARRFVFAVASSNAVSAMDWNEHIQAVSATAMAGATLDVAAIRLLIQTLVVSAIIQPGDIVEIDTAKMTLKINGVNALQYVEGDFFALLPGINYLEYQDSETQRNVQVITRHRARWL